MKWIVFFLLTVSSLVQAYVPTVESLFRHGGNPDVTVNGVAVTLSVKKMQAANNSSAGKETSLLSDARVEDFYRLFFTKIGQETMKVAQTRYDNNSFSEDSLLEKLYYPNFTSLTIKPTPEFSERGIFMGLLKSMLYNDGSFLVNYLKALDVPVRLNSELINREKVEYLAQYKRYLVLINSNRNAKKTEVNPLRPEDPAAREKIEQVMNESMYVDTKQVKLARENGEMAWFVSAGPFEAVVSYKNREVQRVKFKSSLGEFEIICRDYWLANGTHSMPRFMQVKDYKGEIYQVEVTNLRHYLERDEDLNNRLRKWDQLLKGKEPIGSRPPFLL